MVIVTHDSFVAARHQDRADAGRAARPLADGHDTYIPGCMAAATGDGRGRLTAELR